MTNRTDEDERFDVILIVLGPRKISVIKVVREILGLGLAEAKGFVENLPQAVARDVPIDEARRLKRQFEQADASVQMESRASP